MMTVLMEVENSTMPGIKQVIATKEGKANLPHTSLGNIISVQECELCFRERKTLIILLRRMEN